MCTMYLHWFNQLEVASCSKKLFTKFLTHSHQWTWIDSWLTKCSKYRVIWVWGTGNSLFMCENFIFQNFTCNLCCLTWITGNIHLFRIRSVMSWYRRTQHFNAKILYNNKFCFKTSKKKTRYLLYILLSTHIIPHVSNKCFNWLIG